MKHIDEVLNSLDWQKAWIDIPSSSPQSRIEDDSGNKIVVVFSCDGDAWIEIEPDRKHLIEKTCRFRETSGGGGESARVRKALMILAMAIKADNEEQPQRREL